MTTTPVPVVTAVAVGFDSPVVHAIAGSHTGSEIRLSRTLDTLCGAARRGESHTGSRPALTLTSSGYGITCKRCRRSLGLS